MMKLKAYNNGESTVIARFEALISMQKNGQETPWTLF